jgi:imidazolonepropionase-like amidohydrolase
MVEAQEKARDARFMRLAGELAHRPTGPLVIRHARLFVAESASVRPGATVVVVGNRITAVGSDAQIRIPAQAQVIDAAGKTLLPGLWDMHVHISPGEDGLLDVAAGVTSARDMGNDTVMTLVLQRRFASDSLIGPRLMLSGLIDGSGPFQVPLGVLADDSLAAHRAVEWYAAHGYEQIKVYSSMKPELVPGIIAEAHARGLRVSGHVPAFMRAEQVVRLGFDELQHANFLLLNFMDSVKDTRSMARFTAVAEHGAELDFGSQRVRDFVSLLKARGTDIDPTLVAFEDWFTARPGQLGPSETAIADRMPPQVRRTFYAGGLPVPSGKDQRYRDSYGAMLRMVKALYDAGVPVVAGTDAAPIGFALFRELELYAQAGIPPGRVLQLATIGAARIMHHDAERGSIAVGKLADLVLVDGDPTQRISDIRRTSLVVKNGIVYRPAELYGVLGVRP